jgi:uncharacterized membrane protein YgcG
LYKQIDKKTRQPKISIYRDESGPKGDAKIDYEDPEAARAAIEWFDGMIEFYSLQLLFTSLLFTPLLVICCLGKDFQGKPIHVEFAAVLAISDFAGRGRGRGGRGGGGGRGGYGGGSGGGGAAFGASDNVGDAAAPADWTCPG